MRNIKFLLLIAVMAFCQMAAKAEPGVLEAIFRSSGNGITQIVTSNSYENEVVFIRVIDETKNSVAFEASVFVTASSKNLLNCKLPKGNYRVIFRNLKQNAKAEIHPLKIN